MLGQLLHGSWRYFIACIAASLLFTAFELVIPQIIRVSVDSLIGSGPVKVAAARPVVQALGGVDYLRQNLWIPAAMMAGFGLLSALMRYCVNLYSAKAGETLVKTSRDLLYHHIQHLPWKWHMENPTGDIIQRCTSDVERIKTFFEEQFVSVFRMLAMIVFALVCMALMNWKLALVPAVLFPVIIIYSLLFHNSIRERFTACDESEGVLSTIAQENLTGVRVVRAFGRERYERDRFEAHNKYYTDLWVSLAKVMSRFWSTGDALSGLQVMLVVVFGAVFCIRGSMEPGAYIAFISYNTMLTWPVRSLGRMISELSKAGVSLDRIRYIMDSPVEEDKPGAVTPPLTGDIRFEHVNFAYENCPQILHDIDFTMRGGTTLGILGATGSGKSTMMLLLDRLYDLPPESGKITIGGVDIADMQMDYLRRNIGIVLQEPFLFSRTLTENIGITRQDITLSEIRQAAREACLDDTVMSFSKGYDTFVGERGVTLSGGQKQRAAIARILTQQVPIMIFDDSLSAVDTETDGKIRTALEQHFGKASVILISHRITTLSRADQILVLDGGSIVERGTHEELKSAGGVYQRIYEIQSGIAGGEEAV